MTTGQKIAGLTRYMITVLLAAQFGACGGPGPGMDQPRTNEAQAGQDREAVSASAPVITLSAYSGKEGDPVAVTGDHFDATDTVKIEVNGDVVSTATTDGTGHFSQQITMPAWPSGREKVFVTDSQFNAAYAFFTYGGTLTLGSVSGTAGSTVSYSGTGFCSNYSVTIYLHGTVSNVDIPVGTARASFHGDVAGSFTVPRVDLGYYTVRGQDSTGRVATSPRNYGVNIYGSISDTPTCNIFTNDTLQVTASGVMSNATLAVSLSSGQGGFSISTDGNGNGSRTGSYSHLKQTHITIVQHGANGYDAKWDGSTAGCNLTFGEPAPPGATAYTASTVPSPGAAPPAEDAAE